ncbi:MAG: phosphotransferase system glucose/maltose/N-acetylglucosamine-specific IIC component [Candidatus Azotimanducaceae bacterium]|jgi:phosphotransferase system  glucose/maltose/N-acetylglucosamine-specific IIC component
MIEQQQIISGEAKADVFLRKILLWITCTLLASFAVGIAISFAKKFGLDIELLKQLLS